jgi:hypothetical protein
MNLDITPLPPLRDQQFLHLPARFSSFHAESVLTRVQSRRYARGYSATQILMVCLLVLWGIFFLQMKTRDGYQERKPEEASSGEFYAPQITYCLAEKIRLEGAISVVDSNSSQAFRYNKMVDDYTKRCSTFKYRESSMNAARKNVEERRDQLLEEGRKRFASS